MEHCADICCSVACARTWIFFFRAQSERKRPTLSLDAHAPRLHQTLHAGVTHRPSLKGCKHLPGLLFELVRRPRNDLIDKPHEEDARVQLHVQLSQTRDKKTRARVLITSSRESLSASSPKLRTLQKSTWAHWPFTDRCPPFRQSGTGTPS